MRASTPAPGPNPEPPDDLAERELPLRELTSSTFFRGHKSRHGPLYFNRSQGRWADPKSEFGALYIGETDYCSFIEAFNQQILTDPGWGFFVSEMSLDQCCLCPITAIRPLFLVDLTIGSHLRQIGADNRICDGPHEASQRWSRALWEHPSKPDGLYYRSRIAPELCSIALFDRVESVLRTDCDQNVLKRVDDLARILDYFDCALLP